MEKVTTEIVRNVWDDNEGVAISVGPDSDSSGLVLIRNLDKKSIEYFGPFSLVLTPKLAIAVGEAMIAAGKEAPQNE